MFYKKKLCTIYRLNTDPETMWAETKTWIKEVVEQSAEPNQKANKNHWISAETLGIIENRRKIYQSNLDPLEKGAQIRRVNLQVKEACKRDKKK